MPFGGGASGGGAFNGGTITAPLVLTDALTGGEITLDASEGISVIVDGDGVPFYGAVFDTGFGDLMQLENASGRVLTVKEATSVEVYPYMLYANGLATERVSAPADGDVSTSSAVLWIDATPAGTKLMVKAKDSNGTVKTAAINLA